MENGMNDHSYVPAHLAIEAMRDNGYKNTAYAIAELIDNAIEAKATLVELLCAEKEVQEERRRMRVEEIAVLDNGTGMIEKDLRKALQFGNGNHLDPKSRKGIGRFGMGLPASSISQCKRVDVWTWQNGPDSAIHSYLDIVEIRNGTRSTVPDPHPDPIPDLWRKIGKAFGNSGTLVVWSRFDRLMWRTANAVIANSEFLIGRVYRKFIDSEQVKIHLVAFDIEDHSSVTIDKLALPNDPGYLMAKTSCPEPFREVPMFRPWGEENYEVTYTVDFQGEKHDVKIRFSYAKEEARSGGSPGSTPHGKHAGRNVGVSLVRAERELELDPSLVIQYDPRERWWGVEVEFPPALDELLGVTNNKQFARNFSDIATLDLESLINGGKTINEVRCELAEEGDPRAPLIDVIHKIRTQLNVLRDLIKTQTRGSRTRQRHARPTPEEIATEKTRERQQQGYPAGSSDAEETLPPDERKGKIEQSLVDEGVSENVANELAATTVSDNLKYVFAEAALETDAFFSVKPRGGAIIVTLNTRHPAYDSLLEVLEENVDGQDVPALISRLTNALDGLKLLLTAWARYEDELPDGMRKQTAQDVRNDWGRIARNFLTNDE